VTSPQNQSHKRLPDGATFQISPKSSWPRFDLEVRGSLARDLAGCIGLDLFKKVGAMQ